jgi:hypothetical protein
MPIDAGIFTSTQHADLGALLAALDPAVRTHVDGNGHSIVESALAADDVLRVAREVRGGVQPSGHVSGGSTCCGGCA